MLARLHWLWAALLGAGIVGGIVCDPKPARPAAHRAGYRVLEADFHAHTTYSDGSLSPITLVRQAERHGLDVIGVTEHNTVYAAKISRAYASMMGGSNSTSPIVVVGEEITTARFHIIALGLSQTVGADQPPKNVIADIHAQNGVAIAAHPVAQYWPQIEPVRGDFDGAEVMHPIAYSTGGGNWRWSDMIAFYEETNRNSPQPLAAIGSSDFHWGSLLGICRTLVFVKEEDAPPSEESVMEALRARRTVVIDHKGHLWGDAKMIEALEGEPYTPRPADYRYQGEGTVDRILRTLGFLGLVGLVVVGRVKKKEEEAAD